MSFGSFKSYFRRLFDRSGNEVSLGAGAEYLVPKEAQVRNTVVRIHGTSKLIVEPGASVGGCSFQIDSGSTVVIAAGTTLNGVDVCVWNRSELSFGRECRMDHVRFVVDCGKVEVAEGNVFSPGNQVETPTWTVAGGYVSIGDHNHLQNAAWVRFGGHLTIGRYNCINAGSEVRCDESVTVGSYNMVSYDCDIWDTNTHCFYSLEEKKRMFEKDFPAIGRERKKPETKPVAIGDGNWVGKRSCILKGSTLGNETIVGTRAIISNVTVADGQRVLPSKSEIK